MAEINIENNLEELEKLKTALQTGEGAVQFLAPHAIYVEFPTSPASKPVPLSPFIAWVKINFAVDDPYPIAVSVRDKIAEEGTDGVFFATNTLEEYENGKAMSIAERYEGSDDPEAPRKIVEEVLNESLDDAEERIEDADAVSTGYLLGSGVATLGVDADTEEVNITQIT